VDNVPDILRIGDKTSDVYIGMVKNQDVYVGISKNIVKRSAFWRAQGMAIEVINKQKLTRRQARAIEQAMILRHPEYLNKINSISPKRTWYKEAVEWGEAWLKANGI
jgi:hypothetical protein